MDLCFGQKRLNTRNRYATDTLWRWCRALLEGNWGFDAGGPIAVDTSDAVRITAVRGDAKGSSRPVVILSDASTRRIYAKRFDREARPSGRPECSEGSPRSGSALFLHAVYGG